MPGASDPTVINYSVIGYSGDGASRFAGVGTDADGKITIIDAANGEANSITYTVTATAGSGVQRRGYYHTNHYR